MKVIWAGDFLNNSGFSNVTHNICNNLVNKCDLVVYGIGYDGRVKNPYKYYAYHAKFGDDIYNFEYFIKVIKDEKPDVIVIFNDDNIIKNFLEYVKYTNIGTIVVLFPINLLPLSIKNMLLLSNQEFRVSSVLTYTEASKHKVLDINPNLNVNSIYHGVCHKTFFPLKNAKELLGLNKLFIVGNINTNTFRKRLDLFIKGFSLFAKNKQDVRCLIHTSLQNTTYNIKMLANSYGISNKLILSTTQLDVSNLNLLYNLLDVNCNTGLGGGFELSLLEGAACGIPVLCPKQFNLVDIWGDVAHYIKLSKYTESVPNTEFEGEVIDLDDFVDCLERFYSDRSYAFMRGEEAFNYSNNEKFDWEIVSNKVYQSIVKAYNDRISTLELTKVT